MTIVAHVVSLPGLVRLLYSIDDSNGTKNPVKSAANREFLGPEQQLALFVSHAMSQPPRLLGQSETSLSVYAVFWCIASRQGLTQVKLAAATGLSTKTVSRAVSRLGMNDMGLVRQIRDREDGRLKRLILSSKGKTLLARLLGDLKKIRPELT